MSHKFETSIGEKKKREYCLRGQPISSLIAQHDWLAMIWLTWTGREITREERTLLSGCLVACVDHGVDPPSTRVTRIAARCAKPLAEAVAAGLLTLGPRHGNAASAASRWLREVQKISSNLSEFVNEALASKNTIPGFGHVEYKTDPRSIALYALAQQHLQKTPHFDLAFEVSRLLS